MRQPLSFFRTILVAVVLLFLGCGKSSTDDRSGRTLAVFAWSEYLPTAVIERFEKETGVRVQYDTFASNEEMLAKLFSGATRYDIVQPSEYAAEALIAANRLRKLEHSALPNLKNVGDSFLRLPHDPRQEYTVPYMAGTVGIVFHPGRVKSEVRGFKDLFDERFRDRIVVVNDNREMVAWALAAAGKNVNDITPETLASIRSTLEKWVGLVKVWDSDSPKTALLAGDVDLGVVWSGEAARLIEEDAEWRFVVPSEGSHMFVDNLAIPSDAPHPDLALEFMNFCLSAEVAKMISDEFPYTNPNLEARKLLSPAQAKNPASYPEINGLPTFRHLGKIASDIDRLMTEIRARSGR